jgi:hypothetical protein
MPRACLSVGAVVQAYDLAVVGEAIPAEFVFALRACLFAMSTMISTASTPAGGGVIALPYGVAGPAELIATLDACGGWWVNEHAHMGRWQASWTAMLTHPTEQACPMRARTSF